MLRRKRAEIHVNQERWLVSYADFITLLFAFFVVMYSISQVNEAKYRVLSDTFEQAFQTPGHLPSPKDGTLDPESSINPIQVGQPARTTATTVIDVRSEHIGDPVKSHRVVDDFVELSELFSERFGDLIEEQLVTVASNELWLQIELKDSILFASASAEPSPRARTIFNEIAQILKDYPNPVQVEGHTDNLPINSTRYPSNWELSTARASAIVKWLAEHGVDPVRLSAVGFGEYQPLADNSTPEGRAQNRRVTLMIAKRALPRPAVEPGKLAQPEGKAEEPVPIESSSQTSSAAVVTNPQPAAEEIQVSSEAAANRAAVPNPESVLSDIPGVTPVELEDGGLLFTSDPDSSRQGR
jgi:chemotaxis protein MotB